MFKNEHKKYSVDNIMIVTTYYCKPFSELDKKLVT